MRCGGSQRTVWPGESVSVVLPHWIEYSMGYKSPEDSRNNN